MFCFHHPCASLFTFVKCVLLRFESCLDPVLSLGYFLWCHSCTHLFPVLALILSWFVCGFKPFCVFLLLWSLVYVTVHFCAMFHVSSALLLSSKFMHFCFVSDFLVFTSVFTLMATDNFCVMLSAGSLTPAENYNDDYWMCCLKHNTE